MNFYYRHFVFQKSSLKKGGKFSDDFRVTSWGEFMRKTWLDEIPMIYNWIKGDLQLFGVRPLSTQYYNLYTEELKGLRRKVKPGLVPPYYADLPKSLDEVMESEIRYIKRYLEKPVRTQFIYMFKSFINIVIKGARSN
ncbi:sugar transferase [Thermodesulfobacteriota bacterium]